jgi:hypothetical protein
MDQKQALLRHTVATLAYRGAKVLRGTPDGFGSTRVCATSRSAVEIVAHMADLLDWASGSVRGNSVWKAAQPQSWNAEVERFFQGIAQLDDGLANQDLFECNTERLFQGPIADALTYVGQLATLRRLAGAPVHGENYFIAQITAGRVGPDQAAAIREFD